MEETHAKRQVRCTATAAWGAKMLGTWKRFDCALEDSVTMLLAFVLVTPRVTCPCGCNVLPPEALTRASSAGVGGVHGISGPFLGASPKSAELDHVPYEPLVSDSHLFRCRDVA